MKVRNTLCAATACLAVVGAGGAALAESDSGEQASEAKLALSAPHSLLDAVKTAEQAAQGRAVEASIEGDNGRTLYVVSTLASGEVTNVAVDPQSGSVTATEQPGFLARLMDDPEGGDGAKVALADAITAAESAADGKAMEADFEDDTDEAIQGASGPVWAVLVAGQDGDRTMVAVDAQTGKVVASGHPADEDDD